MEDVLDLYHEEYDRERPVVCFDESSKQLTDDVRPPIKAAPGRVERFDTEYQRNGTRNLFMFCEPKGGWRHVEVTGRRTAVDFAQQMKWLVDEAYPEATVIRLVLDNLNTHKLGSLYEAFEPSEARRIAKGLEFHYTPIHGSWLNMAEIEFSVFSRQCLNRRVGDEALLRHEIAALERERNEAAAIIDWRFSTQDARSKLQHIYPSRLTLNGTSSCFSFTWRRILYLSIWEMCVASIDTRSSKSSSQRLKNKSRNSSRDRAGSSPAFSYSSVNLLYLESSKTYCSIPARNVLISCLSCRSSRKSMPQPTV